MSPFFLKLFKKGNPCPHCKALGAKPKLKGYSLCETHLNLAAERWRNWSEQRRIDGKCCYCKNKSFNGWLRCRTHTHINRENCLVWMAANPKNQKLAWQKRMEIRDNGFCPMCKDHPPLVDGFKRCLECRTKNKSRNRRAYNAQRRAKRNDRTF